MGQPIKNLNDYEKFFSKEITSLLTYINEDYIQTFPVKEITTEMFFSAALNMDSCMICKLFDCFLNSIAIMTIQNKLSAILQEQIITAIKPGRKVEYSKELKNLFLKSLDECRENGKSLITSDFVLLSLLKIENGNEYARIKKIFNEHGISYAVLLERSKKMHDLTDTIDADDDNLDYNDSDMAKCDEEILATPIAIQISGDEESLKKLNIKDIIGNLIEQQEPKAIQKERPNKNTIQYCTNLNLETKNGTIDEVIGREKEINRIIEILNKKNKNNVLIIGDSGCGKTAIINGLAKKIADKTAPSAISEHTILRFNVGELLAGTRLRGMVESRMTNLYKDLKKKENTILFIDDLQSFFSEKKDDDYNILSQLLPFLEDRDCKIIAASTYKGYKNSIEHNQEISSRFTKIQIEEPSFEECKQILSECKHSYETYHKIIISDEIIELVLKLCKKYESQKSLIASALDIIDEVGARKHADALETDEVISTRKDLISALSEGNEDKIHEKRLQLTKLLANKKNIGNLTITPEDVYNTFSEYENVPISKLSVSEKKQISKIDEILRSIIIGQDEAIETVSRAIKRNKVGLSAHNKPLSTFLMVGQTGVGKCVCGDTVVTIKNKKTNQIQKITIADFIKKQLTQQWKTYKTQL